MKRTIVLAGIAAALAFSGGARADVCHPEVDSDKLQFVVGYGSLMEEASKNRSVPKSGMNHPVRVTGYQRAWNARGGEIGFSTTYLGVDAPKNEDERRVGADSSAEPVMYAAVYQDLSQAGIEGTDKRESLYCRYEVTSDEIEFLDGWSLPDASQVWIYALPVGKEGDLPDERWPIVQSYVDIFITGCLDLAGLVRDKSVDFAKECIHTTKGWSSHWVNDRLYPRRAFIYQPNAGTIDKLLHSTTPTSELFGSIRIE